ncbi:unnamed protein product [Schistosoma rodhaini]|uniref:RNA polymerase I-specific transcription initiation factor RRN3 n=1 Tax=Schistosoma rodhaini TaxID=6188 RepID=A0A183QF71_9TREM|nr:unnamed protein product [Schistosoma rodhaini]
MDPENNPSSNHVQDIIDLIKQSNDNFKSFKLIREKFSNSISTTEFNDFLSILTNHLNELTSNHVKKLLLDNINTLNWFTYNHNSVVYLNIINLYITSLTYYPNLLYDICEFYINQIFYLKDFINEQLKIENLNQFIDFSIDFFISLCQMIPQSISIIIDLLIKRFPNWRKSIKELIWATYQLLYLLSNQKSSKLLTHTHKCDILSILFRVIIDLELNPDGIQCENLLVLFDNTTTSSSTTTSDTTNINLLFHQFDPMMLKTNLILFFHTIEQLIIHDKNWLKLELICWLLITHISSICTEMNKNSSIELNWNLLCTIFRRVRDLFSEHILPVNVTMVAFPMICFYICSLRGGLVINFIDFLWNIIKDHCRDQGSRLMALSYLCFLLVNGKFCFIDLIIEMMHDMSTWCIDYAYRHRGVLMTASNSTTSLSDNKLYYAICNVLIYIFVQLHSELLDDEHFQSCNRLPIAQISISPFKPLVHIPKELRQLFFRIISTYHLSWSMLGLIQSIHEQDHLNNEIPLTIEMIQSMIPSQMIHIPKNQCLLSLSSPIINCLFRNIHLGKRFMNQQVDNSEDHSKSISVPLTSSSRRKRKAESDNEESMTNESIKKATQESE